MFFKYGDLEKKHLSENDQVMASLIDYYGHINRRINPDIYSSIVHQIVSQQISSTARDTIWSRLEGELGQVDFQGILELGHGKLQGFGMSNRKAEYILDFSTKISQGLINLEDLRELNDDLVIEKLCEIRGIGPWTAQMTLIFSMERPDVISYGDFAIRKGIMLAYGLDELTKKDFDGIVKAYSPYGSVASLYLWEASRGDLPRGLGGENV